jgi:hypothetical protein
MSGHTTTTLAFVRTAAGVVKVPAGGPIPQDVLPSEVLRLTVAGVLVDAAEPDGGEGGEGRDDNPDEGNPDEGNPPPAPKSRRKPTQDA